MFDPMFQVTTSGGVEFIAGKETVVKCIHIGGSVLPLTPPLPMKTGDKLRMEFTPADGRPVYLSLLWLE